MRGWRFNKRYDDNRMLYAVHATLDVLEGLEGDSLAERHLSNRSGPGGRPGSTDLTVARGGGSGSGRW